jgi:D-beta-D-heptose 7-phosphate kinase/D-beta-D-heptose 1-phosphate adenosyltransferase
LKNEAGIFTLLTKKVAQEMEWENIENTTVMCLGDIMLDTFIYGSIERISPEAPVPVFKKHRKFSVLGGAGNVVRNLESLGCKTVYIGVAGMDAIGESVRQSLELLPCVTSIILTEKGRKTPHKTRFVSQGQQILRVDDETVIPLSESTVEAVMETYLAYLPCCQAVVLSDYAKGFLTPSLCEKIITAARQQGIPVIVDPKGHDYQRYQGATLLTPNAKELVNITKMPCQSNEDIVNAAQRLRADMQVDYVLVTRSQEGMTLVSQQESDHIPTQAREVYDVSGAGDTVIATLAMALAVGQTVLEAAKLANYAAGIVVAKTGTAVVTRTELENKCDETSSRKISTLDHLLPLLTQWRRQHLRIGFTNGCFDLLHLGHLHILKQARQTCDRLVLAVNSDASVKKLKGETRPIQSEQTRAEILAALEIVDAVVIFSEDTPLALIEQILPDVLIKGADYRVDQVVGADVVHAHGGRVFLAELLPNNSTTKTIARLESAA